MATSDGTQPKASTVHMLLALAAVGATVPNGLPTSPIFDSILYLLRPFVPPLLAGPDALFHLTGIFISGLTLVLAGVPAALYERLRGHPRSTASSLVVWLLAALALALPGILGAAGYFSIE